MRRITRQLVIILPKLEYFTRCKIDIPYLIYTNNIFYDNKMLGMTIPNNDLISLLINKNFPDEEVLKSG